MRHGERSCEVEQKPTLKELLERHNISYEEFYERCLEVPTADIKMMYQYHICTKAGLQKMIEFINRRAGTLYKVEDVEVAKMY